MTVLDRSQRPRSGKVRPFAFPPFERRESACGLTLYLAPGGQIPMVDLQLLLPIGGQCDPPGRAGLAAMHADLLDEGTTAHTAQELAERLERLGGLYGSGADWDATAIQVRLLSKHFDAGLDTLAEMVRESIFPDEEVMRLRRRRQAEILRRSDAPTFMALQRLRELTYGEHLYGGMLLGTHESLDAMEREDFLAFHRRHVGPTGAALIVVGDFDPGRAAQAIEARFGDWSATEVGPVAPPEPPEPPRGVRISIVDRPGATQTELRIGHLGLMRDAPDLAAAWVANEIFGGAFTSRINLNLRERLGLTYNASSNFSLRRGLGPWVVSSAVDTEATGIALREVLFEMRRMREKAPPPMETRHARNHLVGVFPYTVQTIQDLSSRLETLAVHGLPDDYYVGFPAVLGEVTPNEVLAAARRRFHPDDIRIVAVGSACALRPQLDPFGPIIESP